MLENRIGGSDLMAIKINNWMKDYKKDPVNTKKILLK